jgi:hypothetical protein
MTGRMGAARRSLTAVARGAGLALGLFLASCTCGPTGAEHDTFACATSADCLDGFSCVGGVCVDGARADGGDTADASVDAGRSDAGVVDAGQADAGEPDAGLPDAGEADAGAVDAGACGPEICGNLIDENCNGLLDDGCDCDAGRLCYPLGLDSPTLRYPWDGGGGCSPGLQACQGGHLSAVCDGPHVPQLEACDGLDNDCDGVPDLPQCDCRPGIACYLSQPFTVGVGVCHVGVCNAQRQCVGQGLPNLETCNGLDDDCNGLVDDQTPLEPCGPGVCSMSSRSCVDGGYPECDPGSIAGYAPFDLCGNGLDDNCNGVVDDGCACVVDAGVSCFTGPSSACADAGCLGQCQRGSQRCGLLSDAGAGYGACLGQTLPGTEQCSDTLDNDCDGKTDCADSDCLGKACAPFGRTCVGGSCQCTLDGGVAQTAETVCNDGRDNDCDGLIDCAETACAGQSCGNFGRTCVGTNCTCVVDGGTVQSSETLCSDGRDNDCNGLTDCADTACGGLACATGRICRSGVCTCLLDGGVPQLTETSCSDGVDNDCDGKVDCADSDCAGSSSCREYNCGDGLDNDGDGLIDCADPDCFVRSCSKSNTASFCCAVSDAGCVDVGTDTRNCGQCGFACAQGAACTPLTLPSGLKTGTCGCGSTQACPGSAVLEQCSATGSCTCTADAGTSPCDRQHNGTCSSSTCVYGG